jgi:hypothetical protein
METTKEILHSEELLRVWWQSLPFEALEKIHGIDLIGLNEVETECALNDSEDDWDKLFLSEKEIKFIELYESYISYSGEYEEFYSKLKEKYL